MLQFSLSLKSEILLMNSYNISTSRHPRSLSRLLEPGSLAPRLEFSLSDISYLAANKENPQLLAYITKTGTETYQCYVLESDVSAETVSRSYVKEVLM